MNRWNFLQTYFITIYLLGEYSRHPEYLKYFGVKIPSMLETVYTMAIQDTQKGGLSVEEIDACTGKIEINLDAHDQLNDYVYTESFHNIYFRKNPEKIEELFVPLFAKRLFACKTNMTSIYVSIYSQKNNTTHANMIFIHVGSSRITFTIYEPHGDEFGDSERRVEKFIRLLIASCNKNRDLFKGKLCIQKDRWEISCVRGLQKVVPEIQLAGTENTGYCLMYSYLWLYIVLRCSSLMGFNSVPETTEDETIIFILRLTEKIIIESRTPEKLGRMINAFAGMVVSRHMENINTFYGREVFAKVQEYVAEKFDPTDDSIILSKTIKPYKKEQQIRNTANLPSRKHDNQACNHDDDCMSMFCNNKKCAPRKDDNEACNFHRECMSDYCDPKQKICVEEPNHKKTYNTGKRIWKKKT